MMTSTANGLASLGLTLSICLCGCARETIHATIHKTAPSPVEKLYSMHQQARDEALQRCHEVDNRAIHATVDVWACLNGIGYDNEIRPNLRDIGQFEFTPSSASCHDDRSNRLADAHGLAAWVRSDSTSNESLAESIERITAQVRSDGDVNDEALAAKLRWNFDAPILLDD